MNRTEFYAKTGIKRGLLDSDKLDASVSDTSLRAIVEIFPELNLEWLVTGEGSMLRASVSYPSHKANVGRVSDTKDRYLRSGSAPAEGGRMVPLYNITTPAQLRSVVDGKSLITPADWLRIPRCSDCDGALLVCDTSMYPVLDQGDIALFKAVGSPDTGIFWGGLYLVGYTDKGQERLAVNYVHKSQTEGHIKLINNHSEAALENIPLKNIITMARIKAGVNFKF